LNGVACETKEHRCRRDRSMHCSCGR
jgi:hypothetical protein